jgi:uncharacterized protein (TIGR03067 family)
MRPVASVLVVVLFVWPASPAPKLKPKDANPLVGRWVAVSMNVYGDDWLEANKGFAYTFTADGDWLIRDERASKGGYTIRSNTIDLRTDGGRVLPGIFQLAGDTLTLCLSDPAYERPTEFKGGPRISLFVMRRAEPK